MNKRNRLLINVALSYIVVSVLLFSIFVITYRVYFYRIQEQMVITRARQNEKIFLNAIAEAFRSANQVSSGQDQTYLDDMKWVARIRLKDLIRGLNALLPAPENSAIDASAMNTVSPFIDPEQEAREKVKKLLQPVVPAQDEEKTLVELFDRFNAESKGRLVFKRFSSGVGQMVDMSLILVDTQKFHVQLNDKNIDWDLSVYVEPMQGKKNSKLEIVERFMQQDSMSTRRLGIYPYKSKVPLFQGKDHQLDSGKLEYFETKASKDGSAIFESPEPFKIRGGYEGQDVEQNLLNSFFSDPELELTFVLNRVISEPEWTQFSFFERNKEPILLYIVLAWIVCPLLFWWGIKTSNRFQFHLTADLEGDEDDVASFGREPEESDLEERSSVKSKQKSLTSKAIEDKISISKTEPLNEPLNEPLDEPLDESEPKPIEATASKPENSSHRIPPENSDKSVGPLTRRLQEEQLEKLSMDASSKSDVESIRQNNIRKSSGSFNRHQESGDAEADYLAGVQSDVLKSLIKKLREN